MWKALSGFLTGILLVSVVVCMGEREARIRAQGELADLKTALAESRADLLQSTLEVARLAGKEREARYAEIHATGVAAAVAIATARVDAPGDLDPDGFLPRSLIEPLRLQHERICAGGACGYPTTDSLRSQTYAQAGKHSGGENDAANAGAVVERDAQVGR
jgi:hypothetical protein